MARPAESGCLYFPLDCDFYEDRKLRLLRARFGAKAEAVLVRIWCMIYGGEGWYLHLDQDEIALLSESMGGGFSAGYIRDVISESCGRGIFDGAIFAKFCILTSAGIQKRYLGVKTKKKSIPIAQEYWVLPDSYFMGENAALLLKLQFYRVSEEKTAVISEETHISEEQTIQKKKKGKEIKAKQEAGEPGGWAADFAAGDTALENALLEFGRWRREEKKKPLSELAQRRLCTRLSTLTDEAGVQDRSRYMMECLDASIRNGWTDVYGLKEFVDRAPVHTGTGQDRPRAVAAGADISEML